MKLLAKIALATVASFLLIGSAVALGATLQGFQGGTGFASTTAGNLGAYLRVTSTSPFLTYDFASSTSGSATTTITAGGGTATGPSLNLATTTQSGKFTIVCGVSTCTLTIPPGTDYLSSSTTYVASFNGNTGAVTGVGSVATTSPIVADKATGTVTFSCPSCNTSSLTGSGTANRLTFWGSTNNLDSSASLTYNSTTGALGFTATTTHTGLVNILNSGLNIGTSTALNAGYFLNIVEPSTTATTTGVQFNIQNLATTSFSELVLTRDDGSSSTNFGGLGINNSNLTSGAENKGDIFLEASSTGAGLVLETLNNEASNTIRFFIGGNNNLVLTVASTGLQIAGNVTSTNLNLTNFAGLLMASSSPSGKVVTTTIGTGLLLNGLTLSNTGVTLITTSSPIKANQGTGTVALSFDATAAETWTGLQTFNVTSTFNSTTQITTVTSSLLYTNASGTLLAATTSASLTYASSTGTLSLTIPVSIANGGTGTTTAAALGSLLVGRVSTQYHPLAVGANGTVPVASSTATDGIAWQATSTLGITGASAAGSQTQIQYNDNSTFAATSTFTFSSTTQRLTLGAATSSVFIGANSDFATTSLNIASSATFTYTGATSSFTVPTNIVGSITINVIGGTGGSGSGGAGGFGGSATGTLSAGSSTAGTVYYYFVGQRGATSTSGGAGGLGGGVTGGNGGSGTNSNGGGGGGPSWFSATSTYSTSTVAIVGGGGGGGASGVAGGNAGGLTGSNGANGGGCTAGTGGSQTAGGTGGGVCTGGVSGGSNGGAGNGGAGGGAGAGNGGGGAGGGFFGGGGGGSANSGNAASTGAGGSSFMLSTLTTTSTAAGAGTTDGTIVLTYLITSPTVFSTSTAALYVGGHVFTGQQNGATSTVATCGVNPSVDGDDTAGSVTVGSGVVTSCKITFGQTFANPPVCVASDATSILAVRPVSTTSTLTLSALSTFGGDNIGFICLDY